MKGIFGPFRGITYLNMLVVKTGSSVRTSLLLVI